MSEASGETKTREFGSDFETEEEKNWMCTTQRKKSMKRIQNKPASGALADRFDGVLPLPLRDDDDDIGESRQGWGDGFENVPNHREDEWREIWAFHLLRTQRITF